MTLRTFAAVVSLVLVSATSSGPLYPPFGLDMSARDLTIKPGDDFFQYANGAYLARLVIPPDQASAGRRMDLTKRIQDDLRELLEGAAKDVPEEPKDLRGKAGAFYASFMDEKTIEAQGAKTIKVELDAILAAPDRDALTDLIGQNGLYPKPFAYSIKLDYKRPTVYAATISQTDLGLPGRDYYLAADFAPQRTAYRDYAKTLFQLVGWEDPEKASAEVLNFETRLLRRAGPRSSCAIRPLGTIQCLPPSCQPSLPDSTGSAISMQQSSAIRLSWSLPPIQRCRRYPPSLPTLLYRH